MNPFEPQFPTDLGSATQAASKEKSAYFGGGTTLLDLMKLNVIAPDRLVFLPQLLDRNIEQKENELIVGAGVTMSELADNSSVQERLPVVRQSLILAASPQIRNMATIAGNLLQQTRCPYFRHTEWACNRRTPGSGCSAQDDAADNAMLAVLGTSPSCIASYPGDLAVALVCLDASVDLKHGSSTRNVPLRAFYRTPGDHPEHQTVLSPGELITHIRIPIASSPASSYYFKVRERSSYAFALASAAIAIELDGRGESAIIKSCKVALGGVATIPWHLPKVEAFLKAKTASDEHFEQAANLAFENPVTFRHNAFKVELGKRTLVMGLKTLRDQGPLTDEQLWETQHGRIASGDSKR